MKFERKVKNVGSIGIYLRFYEVKAKETFMLKNAYFSLLSWEWK